MNILNQLLLKHKDWPPLRSYLIDGVPYPIEDSDGYTESHRIKDLAHAIKRGNNESSKRPVKNKEAVLNAYDKECDNGWMLPFLAEGIPKMQKAGVIPIGIAVQNMVDEEGKVKIKRRLTHNCSRVNLSGIQSTLDVRRKT